MQLLEFVPMVVVEARSRIGWDITVSRGRLIDSGGEVWCSFSLSETATVSFSTIEVVGGGGLRKRRALLGEGITHSSYCAMGRA
jgi:hypothetical protein